MKIPGFNGKYESATREIKNQVTSSSSVHRAAESVKGRPDASFKIKDSFREVSQNQPVAKVRIVAEEKKGPISAREVIQEKGVLDAIENFIAVHHPEVSITSALRSHRPVIEQEQFTIFADNQLQLEKLEALKSHMQNAFMKDLNNGFLSVVFKLFDVQTTNEEKKLFTASEKFDHFLDLNPVVGDLKKIFGLELE